MITKKMKKFLIIGIGIMMFTIFSSFLNLLFDSGVSKKKMAFKITREFQKIPIQLWIKFYGDF
jgi:hypothetical protein